MAFGCAGARFRARMHAIGGGALIPAREGCPCPSFRIARPAWRQRREPVAKVPPQTSASEPVARNPDQGPRPWPGLLPMAGEPRIFFADGVGALHPGAWGPLKRLAVPLPEPGVPDQLVAGGRRQGNSLIAGRGNRRNGKVPVRRGRGRHRMAGLSRGKPGGLARVAGGRSHE